jgi:pimeloyl-ACP methyl ester carboxylesterase
MHDLLNYRVFGNGHPVVFLHGFLEDVSMWEFLTSQQIPFQAICIDLPGHGLSQLTDDSPSLAFMADEVLKVLDFLKLSEFHIVGHSMGGYVALLIKEKRKDYFVQYRLRKKQEKLNASSHTPEQDDEGEK